MLHTECFILNVLWCGRKEETVTVYPADVVLFEGILMFYSQEIRDLFQMKLFVDTDADTRLSRRGETHEHDEGRIPSVSKRNKQDTILFFLQLFYFF